MWPNIVSNEKCENILQKLCFYFYHSLLHFFIKTDYDDAAKRKHQTRKNRIFFWENILEIFFFVIADEQETNSSSSGTEETASKKRKITGTKRIEFETAYAKVAAWLHNTSKILSLLYNSNNIKSRLKSNYFLFTITRT